MTKFIPREKRSRKARRELDLQGRTTWSFPPTTRRIESAKAYNRKKKSHARFFEDPGVEFFDTCA